MKNTWILLVFALIISCNKSDDAIKSNAVIIDFNPDKCYCCWGWTIVKGNDTIKSDNSIIRETVGYNIENPVYVNIEIGELENKCSDSGFSKFDYYEVKKIEKIK
ncbi:MAG TPA: hypothetical protein PK904_08605 [Bacteroidales bacterium]|nr:hypothetical protein [Bacteroidales bacterium]